MRGMASSVVAHAPPRCEARSAPSQSPKRAAPWRQRGADASQHASQRFTARSTLSAQYHGHALLSVTALYSITLCTASRHALHNTRSKLTAPSVPRYDPRRRARHDAQLSEWRMQHAHGTQHWLSTRSTLSARSVRRGTRSAPRAWHALGSTALSSTRSTPPRGHDAQRGAALRQHAHGSTARGASTLGAAQRMLGTAWHA